MDGERVAGDKKTTINVQGTAITILKQQAEDFIALTDMAKKFGDDALIYNWMRNRNTLEFLGIWEQIHNPDFKGLEFETFKKEAGLNSFHLTPRKWIDATRATGIQSRAGRYGSTYAHRDIAFEFGSWLSPGFKLYLIKEFQRLKDEENRRLSLDWNLSRALSKINYRIHTDAIKTHIIPAVVTPEQVRIVYASEADLLNVALFGKTAKQWREENPGRTDNMRDEATIEQLLVLANLEGMNAELIRMGCQIEKKTQARVVALFRDTLGYRYLGNWIDRPDNANVEQDLLRDWLRAQGYVDELIERALFAFDKAVNDASKSLYDRNRAVYSLLRYGVKVKATVGENSETVYLIDWAHPERNDFALAEEVTVKGTTTAAYTKRPDVVLYVNGIALGVL